MQTRTIALASILTMLGSFGASAGPTPTYTSTDALDLLMAGNVRFVSGMPEHRNTGSGRIAETSAGQSPFAVVLTCADSRVPAELIFDRGIGDIFVVRVAGNTSGPVQAGSVEYAVEHLGSPLIVVMGHSACGAVKAAASGNEAHGNIGALLAPIAPAIAEAKASAEPTSADGFTQLAVRCNVLRSMSDLISCSPAIATRVESGEVRLVGAVYDLSSGRVEWLGQHPKQADIIGRAKEVELEPASTEHAGATDEPAPTRIDSVKQSKSVAAKAAAKPSLPKGEAKQSKPSGHTDAHDEKHASGHDDGHH